jgi:hypothetical protein
VLERSSSVAELQLDCRFEFAELERQQQRGKHERVGLDGRFGQFVFFWGWELWQRGKRGKHEQRREYE